MIGNVRDQVQENAALSAKEAGYITGSTGLKHIKYEYDLVSGKVNKVLYQDGKWDQFYYKYVYDADNRLSDAYTSRYNYPADAIFSNWIREAHYNYYLHGPLARMELGKNNVQGVDYAYTLQGWLKGVNSRHLGGGDDMSGDGKSGSPFALHGRDVFAFTLGYYANDYSAIGSSAGAFGLAYQAPAASTPGEPGKSLFNGNISHATYAVAGIDNGATAGHSYKYDQLNRLTQMGRHSIVPASTTWDNSSLLAAYKEQISYDANGNIKTYLRNGANSSGLPLAMDDMTYGYHLDVNGRLTSNRLRHVKDPVNAGNYTEDIDNQADDTYVYDKIGNLIADNTVGDEKLDRIQWTIYGKIGSIAKHNGTTINYGYDPSGNRITKQVTSSSGTVSSYYVRDAQGNVLGLYDDHTSGTAGYSWKEQHLYGSSRLGIFNPNRFIASGQPLANDLYDGVNDPGDNGIEGLRAYELSNHLGNVLAKISDRQIAVSSGGSLIDYYNAELLSAQDYYAFGMLVPGRKFGVSGRYGFNGKENDNDVKGEGNQQDYGMRIYDPRVGRFLSVDPITLEYPELTPFQYGSNNPIWNIDLDGLEGIPYTDPKQMLYQGAADITQALARGWDKMSGFFASFKFEKDIEKTKNESLLTTSETTIDFGGDMESWIKGGRYSSDNSMPELKLSNLFDIKVKRETKVELKTKVETKNVKVESKQSVLDGSTEVKTTIRIPANKLTKIPLKVSAAYSNNNSTNSTKVKVEAKSDTKPATAGISAEVQKDNNGNTNGRVGVTGSYEKKVGKVTSTSTITVGKNF